jgi:alpha-1,2-mannosyltransferase
MSAAARRWPLPLLAAAGLAVGLGAVLVVLLGIAVLGNPGATDFAVYRGSVAAMLAGRGLYSYELAGYGLAFTYPPFAGLLLAPIGLVGLPVGMAAWTLLQVACIAVLAVLVWRRTPAAARAGTAEGRLVLALSFLALVFSEPVAHGLALGQVSLCLVTLVVTDNLVLRRWRGVLTGVAAAVKLIPLVFLPYYLFTRQWRQARNLGLGFVGATGLAFLVLPGDSVTYWTSLVLATDRVGGPDARRNASLLGLLAHLGLTGATLTAVWLVLAVAVSGVSLWRAARHHQRGEDLSAVLVVGALSAVVSPISWPHHLVWASLAGLSLVLTGPRWARWLGAGLLAVFVIDTPLMGYDATAPAWLLAPEALPRLCLVALAVLGFPRTHRDGEPSAAERPPSA